ncbi:hypothetical protein HOY80DRAFT_887424 [Tuber brumale]|nr:hypothetical protein HOY80DRAFT_887424 [Tuber brumale]
MSVNESARTKGKKSFVVFFPIYLYILLRYYYLSIYTFFDCVRLLSPWGFLIGLDGWARGGLGNITYIPSILFGPFGDVMRALIVDVILVMMQSRHNVPFVT